METLSLNYQVFNHRNELPENLNHLLSEAITACGKAYAPYSNFFVGASLVLSTGEYLHGCNQENASFPAGLCAERTALYAKGVQHRDVPVEAMAITACRHKSPEANLLPITPCGGCRQVMVEFEHRQKSPIKVLLSMENGAFFLLPSASLLLPFSFGNEFLQTQG